MNDLNHIYKVGNLISKLREEKGYNSVNFCNYNYVKYYMILIYVWFYEFSNIEHKKIILSEIEKL